MEENKAQVSQEQVTEEVQASQIFNQGVALEAAPSADDIAKAVVTVLKELGVVTEAGNTVAVNSWAGSLAQKVTTPTFWLGVVGVVKLSSAAFGITLPDLGWDELANAIAVVGGAIGVIASHIKAK